ncbi:MAG: right-handed parallel beta-helix repeat-containing protein [Bacteroidetes bacterium]|nr:right-handed parallel beta-helix repeat-containing protein [Bacteroidota bacterium]
MRNFSVISSSLLFLYVILSLSCSKEDDNWNDGYYESGMFWMQLSSENIDSTVYYVANDGTDTADGLSESTALRTISGALEKLKPGGGIRILPGIYSEALAIIGSGSSPAGIFIEGYRGRPVLDGKDQLVTAFFFEDCSNLTIRNIEIVNFTDMGLGFSFCTGITVHEIELAHNGHKVQLVDWELEGYGIHVEHSHDILIADSEVHQNGPTPQVFPDRIMGTGINTYANTSVTIKNNRSYDNIGGGILVEDSYDVVVDNNEIFNNDLDASADEWWDGGLWVDGGANILISNNYFHDNLGPGIELSDEDKQSPSGYVLQNNRSTGNYFGIMVWNFGTVTWPDQSIIHETGNEFTGNSIEDIVIMDWN